MAAAGSVYFWGLRCGDAPRLAAAAAVGTVAGIIITPDLDVVGTRADQIIRDTGLVIAIVWGLLWRPYSAIIPHRSILSHGLIIGTLIRLAYLSLPLYLLGMLPTWSPILSRLIAGLFISDNLHIGLDFFVTGVKKYAARK